jgi:RNA ligase (TIGR02306 family)
MENNNSVCYVATINEIKPIDGADNIELAVVGGWSCITKKGTHTVGDFVVIATTDAVIPFELSEKLGVTNYLRNGGRVRTVKLRGVYSECLIMSLDSLPEMKKQYATGIGYYWDAGEDVMELLGIYKYEPPVKMVQLASGRKIRYQDNPNFHVYYKFPNLKNVPDMFTEDDFVEITRKIHGTNARYGIVKKTKLSLLDKIKLRFANKITNWKWLEYEFVVGSHNVEKGSDSQGFYDTNVWYDIEKKYNIKNKLWDYVKDIDMTPEIGDGITLYGEIYGAGIQKGYDYGLDDIKFAVFDIKEDGEYIKPVIAKFAVEGVLTLPYVDVLYSGKWSQEIQDSFVFNNYIPGTKIPEEGIVIKYHTGERQKVAKVINPDYLIYAEKKGVEDSH